MVLTVEDAIARAHGAIEKITTLSSGDRAQILRQVLAGVERRREEFIAAIVDEAKKPVRYAAGEFERCLVTLRLSAEEATRIGGEVMPVDLDPRARGAWCVVERFPKGVVSAISPFNFPLNLVAHKVAPALAAGCPVIVKPSPRTPKAARILVEEIHRAGWPEAGCVFLLCDNAQAPPLWTDPRVAVVSFTGSDAVGWKIAREAAGKALVLELGGNAGAIVAGDADLDDAAARLAVSAFAYAGQVCIKAQRIFVEEGVFARFVGKFIEETRQLRTGDLHDERTAIGPMIDEEAARRVESWIAQAAAAGAKILTGGKRRGDFVEPTVIESAPDESNLWKNEVFGPVALVESYTGFESALSRVNTSRFGLQASLFTRDIGRIRKAFSRLEVGGVIVNDSPSLRIDNFPYGGVKASGSGREGVRFAILEYTEPRVLYVRG